MREIKSPEIKEISKHRSCISSDIQLLSIIMGERV